MIIGGDEPMLQCLRNVQSVNGIDIQQWHDEILGQFRELELFRELECGEVYILIGHVHNLLLIGRPSRQQLISEYSDSPDIDFLIVAFSTQLFGTAVLKTTDNGLSHSIGEDRTAKIAQFYVTLK